MFLNTSMTLNSSRLSSAVLELLESFKLDNEDPGMDYGGGADRVHPPESPPPPLLLELELLPLLLLPLVLPKTLLLLRLLLHGMRVGFS